MSVSNHGSLDDVRQRKLAWKDICRFNHSLCSHCVGRVLENNHGELAVRGNHNLINGRTDLYESNFFLGME